MGKKGLLKYPHLSLKTEDHVIARSKNGGNSGVNKVPCCKPCNTAKCSHSIDEFRLSKFARWEWFWGELAYKIEQFPRTV